jgi:hypothetical protein
LQQLGDFLVFEESAVAVVGDVFESGAVEKVNVHIASFDHIAIHAADERVAHITQIIDKLIALLLEHVDGIADIFEQLVCKADAENWVVHVVNEFWLDVTIGEFSDEVNQLFRLVLGPAFKLSTQ